MKRYYLLTILLLVLLAAVVYVGLMGWDILPGPSLGLLWAGTTVALLVIANELRRPHYEEYNRKKALYPKIPDQYLSKEPPTAGVVFGKDYHTGKLVTESAHHCIAIGSTGSGKTACMLLPSILSQKTGSAQIIDIKSRELLVKSGDISNPKTIIIDLDHKAFYTWGWDIFYKLPKEGDVREGEALKVIQEVASVIVPKTTSGDTFWSDAAKNEFIGLMLFEFCYGQSREFIDIINTMMTIPLRDHLEIALNTVPRTSLVASYLTSLAAAADETLFSVDLTLSQNIYHFVSEEAVWFLRDNPRRANPTMLNEEGVRQYLCCSEEKLDAGFDKLMVIVMKQTLTELQSRTTGGSYPLVNLYWDEFQKLSESLEEIRKVTASFLKTARSKNCALTMVVQNLDGFDKSLVYDIVSNVHYLFVLSSNNANSLTSEVVCKMAGDYVEKEKSYTEGKGTSSSVSFREKPVLKPDDLNNLGEDAVLIITNHGYARVKKQGYYCTEPYKSQYEKIIDVNREVMADV